MHLGGPPRELSEMSSWLRWLEAHDQLSGWAQFFGAMLALILTYFTAFSPQWARRRQLRQSGARLLLNAYEVVESYHRTSDNFLPTSLSIKFATMTMLGVAEEIERFPVYELDSQGPRSIARNLVAVAGTLKGIALFLDQIALELDGRDGNDDDKLVIRDFVRERMEAIQAIITGAELKRPEWPTA